MIYEIFMPEREVSVDAGAHVVIIEHDSLEKG
jgi:hypothetical protein